MNNEDKKKWIIRYIKKNKMEDILAEKYKCKKGNWLKRYSNEIQSVCAILSVLAIGVVTVILSNQNNKLVETQNEIMRNEQKPIIDIIKMDENEETDKLLVVNNGTDVLTYNIEVYTYLDVLCNENKLGTMPIRVYFLNAYTRQKCGNEDGMEEISIYTEEHSLVSSLKNDLHHIIDQYNNLYWDFSFTYLIKVTSVDILNEENRDYFLFSRNGIRRVDEEYYNEVVDEHNYMIDNHDGTHTSKEYFFELEECSADRVFEYALSKIRDENLYQIDYKTGEKMLYGQYEPK